MFFIWYIPTLKKSYVLVLVFAIDCNDLFALGTHLVYYDNVVVFVKLWCLYNNFHWKQIKFYFSCFLYKKLKINQYLLIKGENWKWKLNNIFPSQASLIVKWLGGDLGIVLQFYMPPSCEWFIPSLLLKSLFNLNNEDTALKRINHFKDPQLLKA